MADIDESVQEAVALAEAALTDEQREQLSKALFPDSDTTSVTVYGKTRELTPLPLKYSRQINSKLTAFNTALKKAQAGGDAEVTEEQLADGLVSVAKIIATKNDWSDLQEALEEEEVLMDEIQALVVCQTEVQQRNDFLLTPLRVLVTLLRKREILTVTLLQSTNFGLA